MGRLRIPAFIMAVIICLMTASASYTPAEVSAYTESTAKYVQNAVPDPVFGSIGGEWAVLALARSGYDAGDEYYRGYLTRIAGEIKNSNGVLHRTKYTEYSRVILALTALGQDAADFAGYNLTIPLGDFTQTTYQGINGAIWALIALDSKPYDMPVNKDANVKATRQMYVDAILAKQHEDGGWSMGDRSLSDTDLTAMALQALSAYRHQTAVEKAVQKGIAFLSKAQNENGNYGTYGEETAESVSQVLIALATLGIPVDDERFVKNGKSALDALMTYRLGSNGFKHLPADTKADEMATEQAFIALASLQRKNEGKTPVYKMTDAKKIAFPADASISGLTGKNADVHTVPVSYPGKTFPDIAAHPNRTAIEALASRGIIDGMASGIFKPDADMTRAQFAAITVRALGLEPENKKIYTDVSTDVWYAGYIATATKYGIVNGVGDNKFNPNGTINRQQAATMVARAAKLCGMDTAYDSTRIRDTLAPFADYMTVSDWARGSMAFCFDQGISDDSAAKIEPKKAILRCEIAQMLHNMLKKANLI